MIPKWKPRTRARRTVGTQVPSRGVSSWQTHGRRCWMQVVFNLLLSGGPSHPSSRITSRACVFPTRVACLAGAFPTECFGALEHARPLLPQRGPWSASGGKGPPRRLSPRPKPQPKPPAPLRPRFPIQAALPAPAAVVEAGKPASLPTPSVAHHARPRSMLSLRRRSPSCRLRAKK